MMILKTCHVYKQTDITENINPARRWSIYVQFYRTYNEYTYTLLERFAKFPFRLSSVPTFIRFYSILKTLGGPPEIGGEEYSVSDCAPDMF